MGTVNPEQNIEQLENAVNTSRHKESQFSYKCCLFNHFDKYETDNSSR